MAASREENIKELQARALQLRIDSLRATTASGSGHPTTCLSLAEIIVALFYKCMNFDLADPKKETNDRFILSAGHAVPILYAIYKQLGVLSDEELMKLREFNSPLEGHPTPRFIYNEAATGSLGQGLAIAAGMALYAQKNKLDYKTYVLLGDGESAEGSVWEAAEFAAYYNLNNLIGFVDCNRLGQSGQTMYAHSVERFVKNFEAFGWKTFVVDGHDITSIISAVEQAKALQKKPGIIITKTIKGYGVDLFEDKNGFHGKPLKQEELDAALQNLKNRFPEAAEHLQAVHDMTHKLPLPHPHVQKDEIVALDLGNDPHKELFEKGKTIATRKAFGYALAALGRVSKKIWVLDGDVKNSTYTEIFEKEFYDRFVQCFIAEQTMVGVATGLQSRGTVPFAATFGAFLTRAHDQIRMAGVGRNALRLCGSHAGVSIGQDGPSQMGLEDICMMRAIPQSIVLYPSDGVSSYKLVEQMAHYHDGISYIRTTRATTPVLYNKDEKFVIGGCKIIKQGEKDHACVVAAGITLHEALKAYEQLKAQGIHVAVIDAYSVKPLDAKTIQMVAQKANNRIITVEDHYPEGGLGEAVAQALACDSICVEILAVKTLSRSGTPEELLAYAGIDAASIVKKIKEHP